ncbi:cytochrome c biogenesis CcdA family protein [Paracoccus tegillarcae]|uniref:Cytochrome C biogenesis protein CcdA n=1 Tax=Paracoccus tegillarcae TaxID=1529068 RepID=A0A2K9F367_9RHOB|nr:cytochrome c biogenesis protein CcdA [Paracoccus tegillarcae]AUH34812.1 cytochrome C biogenesis protein CcdA [Paracoccus tegillarcae]
MPEIGYLGAAVAGLLAFFSPCILPMVPFYLAYIGGLSVAELRDGSASARGRSPRTVIPAIAFASGVTSIFMLLGLGATMLGRAFAEYYQPLSYLAAAILIVFGLHFLGVLRISFLFREARLSTDLRPGSVLGAYVMGLAFGFGWTPCVGPALAAILMIASGSGDLWHGSSLLLVFGLGMTLPFVIVAFLAPTFMGWMARHRKSLGYVEKAMGLLLILFGVLIASGNIDQIADWLLRNFSWSATVI